MSFYISKIFWLIINPLNVLILLTILNIIFTSLNLRGPRKITLSFLLFFFAIFCFLPTGKILLHTLEKKFHDYSDLSNVDKIDGILIMGGSTNPLLSSYYNQIIFNDSAERLFEARRVINKFPEAKIIFSGGLNETRDARIFFNQNNINLEKIILEANSRNTYENILFSEKISNQVKNEKWLVVSSAYHLSRSINVAKNIGWILHPYPVDFQVAKKFKFKISLNFFSNLSQMHLASHEWIAIFYYYLTGKTQKLL